MMKDDNILAIIQNELSMAEGSTYGSGDHSDLESSLDLYLGNPYGDEVEGRSKVISTDIADAIEWIMPQIMKSFTQNGNVVVFDPVHDGDELQAEIESQYVFEVLMKQNDGFIILHQFVKDALMQRIGILKVYYENVTKTKISDYTGITDDQLAQLAAEESIEILEHTAYVDQYMTDAKNQQLQSQINQVIEVMRTNGNSPQLSQMLDQLQAQLENPVTLNDVKIAVKRTRGQIYIDPVPPEELRVNSQHNSISLDKARFTAHVTTKSRSDIMEEFNLSLKEVNELPSGTDFDTREYRFSAQGEATFYEDINTGDRSQDQIDIAECYLFIDIDEVGIARYMKITAAGGDVPVKILDKEEIDMSPWVTTTAILMSHKFKGLSITDRIEQIQRLKTTLWRNMLDNIYLQNNQRLKVIENQVNIDDLLVSRPGGLIRVKRQDAVMPLETNQIQSDAWNMMNYLDEVRAGRTGVDADGATAPSNIGDRVGSEGVDRLMSAKEELVGLIVRVMAETGIKPLCYKIRDLTMKHYDAVIDFRFRQTWYKLNPSQWCDRTTTTVRVGTGTGNRREQLGAIQGIIEIQKALATDPSGQGTVLLSHQKSYNTIDDYCKFSGLNSAAKYFVDPQSQEGTQKLQQLEQSQKANQQQQQEIQAKMQEVQAKMVEAEQMKASAQIESVRSKAQIEFMKNELKNQEQSFNAQIENLKRQLDEAKLVSDRLKHKDELQFKYYKQNQDTAVKLTDIKSRENEDLDDEMTDNSQSGGAESNEKD